MLMESFFRKFCDVKILLQLEQNLKELLGKKHQNVNLRKK